MWKRTGGSLLGAELPWMESWASWERPSQILDLWYTHVEDEGVLARDLVFGYRVASKRQRWSRRMAEEQVNLADGGLAVVIVSKDYDLPDAYEYHKQVLMLPIEQISCPPIEIEKHLPPTTRVVLCSDGIPAFAFQGLTEVLKKRGVPWVTRRNQQALEQALRDFKLPTQAKAQVIKSTAPTAVNGNGAGPKIAPRGSIRDFILKHADLRKGSSEEARRLMHVAKTEGIETTFGSLAQGIAQAKRKGNFGDVPKSVLTVQQQALRTLDDAIAGLGLIRDYVEQTEQRNAELQAKVDAIAELFKK